MTLPRLRINAQAVGAPGTWFDPVPERLGLEVGFGGGEHAWALTAADPALGLVACEVFDNGICSLLSRLVPEDADPATAPLPRNLRLFDDDARILLRVLPPACLDLLVLMFPDPWPKARHAKRRFVHPAQVPLVARALRPGAEWRVASDDPTYQAWVEDTMADQPFFVPHVRTDVRPDGWPATRFEAKAFRAGRQPRYWSFRRADGAASPETQCSGTATSTV